MQSLIQQLEQLLDHSVHVFFGGRVLLDESAIRHIIDEMRLATADEAKIAQRVAAERETMLSEARAQARRIVEEAQSQANSRIDEHSTSQAARERARAMIADAELQASRLRTESKEYAAHQLQVLEARLQRIMQEVQAGQRFLAEQQGEHGKTSQK